VAISRIVKSLVRSSLRSPRFTSTGQLLQYRLFPPLSSFSASIVTAAIRQASDNYTDVRRLCAATNKAAPVPANEEAPKMARRVDQTCGCLSEERTEVALRPSHFADSAQATQAYKGV
jgi:hypothetical protein